MRVLFFPLENYARELDARSLIISKLSRIKSIDTVPSDNMICVLLPKNLLPLILSKISQPVTVLHKSLQLHFREFISSIVSKGGSYFFLEEEYFDRYSDNSVRFDPKATPLVPSLLRILILFLYLNVYQIRFFLLETQGLMF